MDVTPIIDRLKTQLTGFVLIAGAADLDIAIDATPNAPAAHVMPLAETAEAPDLAGLHHQRVLQEFGVVVMVANLQDATGSAAAVELHARRLAVRAALVGWVPDPASGETVAFTGGRLLQFFNQRLWWMDQFRVLTDYRSA